MTFRDQLTSFKTSVIEAYEPKREPTENVKFWAERSQKSLKGIEGRKHKSGHPTKPMKAGIETGRPNFIDKQPGEGIKGQRSGRGRRGGLGGGDWLATKWARADRDAYKTFERQQAKKDIAKELEPEAGRGVRQGLSKDKPSGFFGKTARETTKQVGYHFGNKRAALRSKVDRKYSKVNTGPKKTSYADAFKQVTPDRSKDEPAKKAEAEAARNASIERYKTLKKAKKKGLA